MQRRDLGGRLGGRRRPLGERNRLDVGGALADRLERLALEAGRGRNPERVDGIGEQQHLDASRAKTFELRARGQALGVLAGEVVDRGLVLAQVLDIIGERAVAVGMLGRYEARDLVQRVAPLRVLVKAFLDDGAEMLPDLGEFLRLALRELGQFLHDPVGHALADRAEDRALLNHFARDVERQVGAVDDEAHEAQPARQQIGVLA